MDNIEKITDSQIVLTQIVCDIQHKLKAPKGQYNSFGQYKYRSCEDILEGVKPLLKEYKIALLINDEIVQIREQNEKESIESIAAAAASSSSSAGSSDSAE